MEKLKKYKRNPEGNNGWSFDYEFLNEIERMVEMTGESLQLEELEAVFTA